MTHLEMVERMNDVLPSQTFAESANLVQRLVEAGHLQPDHVAAIDAQTAAFVQARMMGRPVSFRYVDGTHETFNA